MVADQYGVLPRGMSEVLRNKSEDALTAHEAVFSAFGYFARITPEEHAVVRRKLERAGPRLRRITPTAGRCCP